MADRSVPAGRGPEQPSTAPSGAPRWLGPALLAAAVLVLGSNVFHVVGLAASGVTSTDGEAAYGVRGGDVSTFLPPGLSHVVGGTTVMAVIFGPLVMVPVAVVAARLLWISGRRRASVDVSAAGAVLAVVALVVLLVFWGDELWVWALD
ncbi:hypothetical protein [Clavibacter michiganensis]|uniref:hypothetical protein n=1 Tax=Clavibacter michiganensis TaxID=28447 RepID=UPI000A3B59DE|nr:hypothetical protein [Clavibacter michiganensis]